MILQYLVNKIMRNNNLNANLISAIKIFYHLLSIYQNSK